MQTPRTGLRTPLLSLAMCLAGMAFGPGHGLGQGTNPVPADPDTLLKQVRLRMEVHNQKMTEVTTTVIRQARRSADPVEAQTLLKRTLQQVEDDPDLGEACRTGLVGQLQAALRERAPVPPPQPDRGPKPDTTPKAKRYELRMVRLGNTFQAVRFNVASGETWSMVGEKYEKIPETGRVPAGDYEVHLVAREDGTDWMGFRIDRLTGSTWQLRGNKWNKVKEPDEKEKSD